MLSIWSGRCCFWVPNIWSPVVDGAHDVFDWQCSQLWGKGIPYYQPLLTNCQPLSTMVNHINLNQSQPLLIYNGTHSKWEYQWAFPPSARCCPHFPPVSEARSHIFRWAGRHESSAKSVNAVKAMVNCFALLVDEIWWTCDELRTLIGWISRLPGTSCMMIVPAGCYVSYSKLLHSPLLSSGSANPWLRWPVQHKHHK